MKWFKLHSEIKDDPKLLEMDDHQRWLWICILAVASEAEQRGVIRGVRMRGLSAALRTSEDALAAALALWSDLDMVDHDTEECTITIIHWDERQYEKPSDKPEATRDRKRKSRQSHADVTPSHALDTDTDTDTDHISTSNDVEGASVPLAAVAPPKKRERADVTLKADPRVIAYHEFTNRYPQIGQMKLIIERDPPLADFIRALREWSGRGFNVTNITGILDWACNPKKMERKNGPQRNTSPTNNGNRGSLPEWAGRFTDSLAEVEVDLPTLPG